MMDALLPPPPVLPPFPRSSARGISTPPTRSSSSSPSPSISIATVSPEQLQPEHETGASSSSSSPSLSGSGLEGGTRGAECESGAAAKRKKIITPKPSIASQFVSESGPSSRSSSFITVDTTTASARESSAQTSAPVPTLPLSTNVRVTSFLAFSSWRIGSNRYNPLFLLNIQFQYLARCYHAHAVSYDAWRRLGFFA
jgi:hypothetical protein